MKTYNETFITSKNDLDRKINAIKDSMAKEGREFSFNTEDIGNGQVRLYCTYTDTLTDEREYTERVETFTSLKTNHDYKINAIKEAYPPEMGFSIRIISTVPIDNQYERITVSIRKTKSKGGRRL